MTFQDAGDGDDVDDDRSMADEPPEADDGMPGSLVKQDLRRLHHR